MGVTLALNFEKESRQVLKTLHKHKR